MSARNVLNSDAVIAFTDSLSELAESEAVAAWTRKTARRWILKSHERGYRVERDRRGRLVLIDPADEGWDARAYEGDVPDWAAAAIDDGKPVVFLKLDGTLNKTVRRAIEYLDDLAAGGEPDKVGRMSFEQAVRAAKRERRDRAARRRRLYEPGTIPVYRYGDTAVVLQLTSPDSLAREGNRMNHCVADYADAIRLGECEIYSVRDLKGEPQATVEVDPDGFVMQVKGRANGPVAEPYKGAVRDFIRSRGYAMLADFENVAFALPALDPRSDEFEAFLQSADGQALLRAVRFWGSAFETNVERAAQYALVRDYCYDLRPSTARAVFRALSPGRGAPVRLRQIGGYWVYDEFVALVCVDVPLLLMNLVRDGVFRQAGLEEDGRRVLRAVEGILPTLVFRELDRVYLLGATRSDPYDWRFYNWNSTADFLLDCPVDIRDQRSNRHRAMLERLNRAKRRVLGRRQPASDAHIAVRRIVSGTAGVYAI